HSGFQTAEGGAGASTWRSLRHQLDRACRPTCASGFFHCANCAGAPRPAQRLYRSRRPTAGIQTIYVWLSLPLRLARGRARCGISQRGCSLSSVSALHSSQEAEGMERLSTVLIGLGVTLAIVSVMLGVVELATIRTIRPPKEKTFSYMRLATTQYRTVFIPAVGALISGLFVSLSASFFYGSLTGRAEPWYPEAGSSV